MFHKAVGIIILALALKKANLSWNDIGFQRTGFVTGIMGIKWGLLYRMTGNLWVGLGDHLFNNTAATNMLHVVSPTGADELQIVRIMAAQRPVFCYDAGISRSTERFCSPPTSWRASP